MAPKRNGQSVCGAWLGDYAIPLKAPHDEPHITVTQPGIYAGED